MPEDPISNSSLRLYLQALPAGPVTDTAALVKVLQACWHELDGSSQSKMEAWKLDRMEDVEWQPPELSFTIERHGGTVLGSTRADLQSWTVNLDRHEASSFVSRFRQLSPRDKPLKTGPLVAEIVAAITSGSDDDRLYWLNARSEVRVLVREFIGGDYKRTVAGRRKRFSRGLEQALKEHGWSKAARRLNVYRLDGPTAQSHSA